ncbi:type II secretion system F family protein [Bythopirellula polymerisocia]|uniref:Bacterial type II secretion system protein F domain protein n=1 Tax=Bythopirellula polymerisocia TaxID=2528003 RepID=A0A5C6CM31_9BACT|nr:type II secretion system F family protein [Bythopirellula polymerisocia]TWU25630.1 Bacterial type II secretion system protein F domain protein [Bythopirellula polymerisocia]
MSLLASSLFDSPLILHLSIIGCTAAVIWWLLEVFAGGKPRAEERLKEIRDPNSRKVDLLREGKGKGSKMSQVLSMASPALSKPLQPKSNEDIGKTRSKLNQAGFRGPKAPEAFWALKMVGLVVGFLIGGGAVILTRGFNIDSITYSAGIGLVMFFLPEVVIWFMTKSRQDNIFYGLPDALDLMVVCVEAGLGLDQAMRKVAEEMKKAYRIIAEEFGLCNLQLQMGRARNEVLHDLGSRTGVDDLKALAAILIQADKFGSSVAQALRVQSDSMRTRRRQMAEEKAAKTAVKLIFPLVLFIFPAIFVVLVGPAAITMINELFPSMNPT